jgi:hypothetical protein
MITAFKEEILKDMMIDYSTMTEDDKAHIAEDIESAYRKGMQDADTNTNPAWQPIRRGADGFVDEEYVQNMLSQVPFIVRYQDGYTFAVNNADADCDDWDEWYSDIERHPDRFMWLPLPKFNPKAKNE